MVIPSVCNAVNVPGEGSYRDANAQYMVRPSRNIYPFTFKGTYTLLSLDW